MEHQQSKLERPERVAELNPTETLQKMGFGSNDVLCDIGAGTGVFSIPAAKISKNTVFAVDINQERLIILKEKAQKQNLTNLVVMKVDGYDYEIGSKTVDVVLLVAVLHEIENKEAVLTEINRILKSEGKLAVIEFYKRPTPMGPPVPHRMGEEEVIRLCGQYGFAEAGGFDLGENFYCLMLQKR